MDGNIATLAQGQCASPGLPGLQYSTYPYQVPDGHGGLASLQLAPQGWLGNVLGQVAQPIGAGFGGVGAFGNPQLGGVLGGWGGQLPNLIPISATQGFPQTAQQIFGAFGQPGWAVPGNLAAYYATPQQQLATQGWLGSFIGQAGQPIGYGVGGVFGIPQIGNYVGGFGSQLSGYNPFSLSPQGIQAAQHAAQQAGQVAQQVAQQGAIQVAQQAALAAQQVGQQVALQAAQQVGQQAAQVAQQVAHQVAAACVAQQQSYSPFNALGIQSAMTQPWGNLLGQIPQPFGSSFGGVLGYPQLGAFGALAGQVPLVASPLVAVPQQAIPGGFGGWTGVPAGGYAMIPQGIRALNPFAGAPLGNQTQLGATPRFSFA